MTDDPAHYESLVPKSFRIVQRMSIHHVPGPPASRSLVLDMVGSEGASGGLQLRFFDVRNLAFRQPLLSVWSMGPLEIRDISSRGWEDVRYEVLDPEEDAISFLCARFDA